MNSIKGVVFDLDGTLYSQRILRILIAIQLLANFLISPFKTRKAIKIILAFRKSQELIRNENVNNDNLLDMQLERTCLLTGRSKETVHNVIEKWFFKKPLSLLNFSKRHNLSETLRWLKNNNYKIGIYSDYPCEEKSKALGVYEYVDCFVSSTDRDVGSFKPNAKGYLRISKKLNEELFDLLFVGDREEVDLLGAANAGMQAFLLPGKQFSKVGKFPSSSTMNGLKQYLEKNGK